MFRPTGSPVSVRAVEGVALVLRRIWSSMLRGTWEERTRLGGSLVSMSKVTGVWVSGSMKPPLKVRLEPPIPHLSDQTFLVCGGSDG